MSHGPSFDESVSQSDSSDGDGSNSESSSVYSDCEYSTYGEEDDDDDDYDDKTNDDSVVDASVSEVGSSRRSRSGSDSSVFSGCEVDAEEEYYEDFDGSRSCVSSSVFSDSEPEIEDEDVYESSTTPFFGIKSMTDAIKNMFSNIGHDDLFASDGNDDRHHDNESVSLQSKNNDASHDDDHNRKTAKGPVASDDSKADGSPNESDLPPVALDNQKDNESHKSERGMVASDGYEDNGYYPSEIVSVLWISQKDNDQYENEIELVASDDYEDNGSNKSNTVSVLWQKQEGDCFIQSPKEHVPSDDNDSDDDDDEEADIRHIADMLSVSWDGNDGQYDSEKELDAWFIDQLVNDKVSKELEDGSSWYDDSPSKGGTAPSTHVSESSRERSSQQVKHSISSPPSDDSCFDGCDSSDTSNAIEDTGFVKGMHPRGNEAYPSVIHSIKKTDTPFDESYDGDWSVGELHGDDDNSLSFLDDDFNKKERTVAMASSTYKIPDDITFTTPKPTRKKKPSSPRFRVTVVQRDAPTKSAPIIRASAGGRVVTSSCIADDECSI